MPRPNCYECVFRDRANLLPSGHSKCTHPLTAAVHAQVENQLIGLLGKRSGRTYVPLDHNAASLHVEGHEAGIRNGWFLWPINYDPVWLTRCDGFTLRDAQTELR